MRALWPRAWTWTSRSFPSDVSPASGGAGIYDKLIPILQQWNQQYNFVGSYYINIGDNAERRRSDNDELGEEPALLSGHPGDGGRDRQLTPTPTSSIRPPRRSRRPPPADTPAGSTQMTLNTVPSFAGVTVGMFVTVRSARTRHPGAWRSTHASHRGLGQHHDPQLRPRRISALPMMGSSATYRPARR